MTVHGALASVSGSFQSVVTHGCARDQLHRCVKTAEPLLRNPDYVVPSTTADVAIHCRSVYENMNMVHTNNHDLSIECLGHINMQIQHMWLTFSFLLKGSALNLSIASVATPWFACRATDDNSNYKTPSTKQSRMTKCVPTWITKQVLWTVVSKTRSRPWAHSRLR